MKQGIRESLTFVSAHVLNFGVSKIWFSELASVQEFACFLLSDL